MAYTPEEIAAMTPAEREAAQERLLAEWWRRREAREIRRTVVVKCPPSSGMGGYGPSQQLMESWKDVEEIVADW